MVLTPRVLVVDDDPEFLDLVVQRLSQEDRFEVVAAGSAHGALETLDERTIDCVVTDSLVLDSGKPLVRAVREYDEDMPLIYYTGKDWTDVADDAVAAGISDYVQKGVGSFTEVAKRIDVLVESDANVRVESVGSDPTNGRSGTPYTIPQLDGNDGEWTVIGEFEMDSSTALDVVLAETIANYLNREVDSFSLYDGVDAEALERLVLPSRGGGKRRSVTVRFPLDGYLVAVTSSGKIALKPQSPSA